MPLMPPIPPSAYVEQAPAQRMPGPDHPGNEPHYEEPPDLSTLKHIQMSQRSLVITGDNVPGTMGMKFKACDPELIATANRVLQRWFMKYQRQHGGHSI